MFIMLVMATAFIRIVHAKPCKDRSFEPCLPQLYFHDEGMASEIAEELIHHEHEIDARNKREQELPSKKNEMKHLFDEYPKNSTGEENDGDFVDREDHVTQYLSDLMVNTDSEITSLQASEIEEARADPERDEGYLAFIDGFEDEVKIMDLLPLSRNIIL